MRAAPGCLLFVLQRRIPEDKVLPTAGRTIISNDFTGQTGQTFSVLAGISDSGRAEDKARIRAVKLAKTAQATQDAGDM